MLAVRVLPEKPNSGGAMEAPDENGNRIHNSLMARAADTAWQLYWRLHPDSGSICAIINSAVVKRPQNSDFLTILVGRHASGIRSFRPAERLSRKPRFAWDIARSTMRARGHRERLHRKELLSWRYGVRGMKRTPRSKAAAPPIRAGGSSLPSRLPATLLGCWARTVCLGPRQFTMV